MTKSPPQPYAKGSPSSTPTSSTSANSKLSSYARRTSRQKEQQDRYARLIVPALANRRYHLPGNDWSQDLIQYFKNNHPIFGMCCHHPLHPLKRRERIVCLVGSIAFGLVITNVVFLWFYRTDRDINDAAVEITISDGAGDDNSNNNNATAAATTNTTLTTLVFPQNYDTLTITNGMIVLWTLGGAVHSMFDLTVWHMSACACCRPGGSCAMLGCLDWVGSYVAIVVVICAVALATFVVVLRATLIPKDYEEEIQVEGTGLADDDVVEWGHVDGIESFEFLLGYVVEVMLALLVYYPVLGTILFSGVLGCGRLPLLGGRPREMRQLKARTKKRNSSKAQAQKIGRTSRVSEVRSSGTMSPDSERMRSLESLGYESP